MSEETVGSASGQVIVPSGRCLAGAGGSGMLGQGVRSGTAGLGCGSGEST
jgi:hypothetical protein